MMNTCNFLSHIRKLLKPLISATIITFIASPNVVAEVSEATQKAIYACDIPSMLRSANISEDDERAVVDAFCCDIDLNKYSYEQLIEWNSLVKSQPLSDMLSKANYLKKLDILNEIRNLTAEEFIAYTLMYPQRKYILSQYIQDIFIPNLSQLSLLELIYYDDYMPEEFHQKIYAEIKRRDDEVRALLSGKENDYAQYEKTLNERLKYLIEYNLWTFYVDGHKELNNAYSQIGIVPDDPYIAAEQYQRLVSICFPKQEIRDILQAEVNKYCAEINKARAAYHKISGKEKFRKAAYKVPNFNIDSYVSVDPLRAVSAVRERYLKNREDVSTGTSVLGFLFGGWVGLVAQGIGDWMAIEGLVDGEYEARKQYMENVQESLVANFANYAETIIKGIDKAL